MTTNSSVANSTSKKAWQKPDFQILDRATDINAKNNFATNEASVKDGIGIWYKNTKTVMTASIVGNKSSFHS